MTYTIPLDAINESLSLLPERMTSDEAKIMLIAIGLQESRFKHRKQIGGPAHGFWQFESGGGVKGVMSHPSSRYHARKLCGHRGVEWSQDAVYNAIVDDDVLAAGFARLLLWTDPHPLPNPWDADETWNYYIRNWRPGRPHPHTWPGMHAEALRLVE